MRPVVASGHVNHLFERKEDDDARSGDGDFAPLFHLLCCCFVCLDGGKERGGEEGLEISIYRFLLSQATCAWTARNPNNFILPRGDAFRRPAGVHLIEEARTTRLLFLSRASHHFSASSLP